MLEQLKNNGLSPELKKLRALQADLLEVMESPSFSAEIEDLRSLCKGKQDFTKWMQELVQRKCGPVWEKHDASFEWQAEQVAAFAGKDEQVMRRHKRFEEILSYESLGPLKIQKGDCVEVAGLQSESGKPLNGQKCTIRGFDEQKGRYEVRFVPEKLMHIKPDNLRRLEDQEIVLSVQGQVLDQLYTKAATDKLDALRAKSGSKGEYEHLSGEFLGGILGPIQERHGVDGEWLHHALERLVPEHAEIRENQQRFDELAGFGKLGGADVQKGDCVKVSGLSKEEEASLYSLHGMVKGYDKEKKLYAVSLPSKKEEVLVHVKAGQLRKLDDKGKLSSIQVQLLDLLTSDPEVTAQVREQRAESGNKEEWEHRWGELFGHTCGPICERHGVDVEWFLHMSEHLGHEDPQIGQRGHKLAELSAFGSLGPLGVQRGDCVEISGLTSASEKKLNGQKGLIKGYDKKTELYEVGLVPERLVSLRPANLKVLDEGAKLVSLLSQLLEATDTPEVRGKLDRLRAQSVNPQSFQEGLEKMLKDIHGPIYERHGAGPEWLEHAAGHAAGEAPAIGLRHRRLQALTAFGQLPPFPVMQAGTHLVVGGHSERLNDQVVIVQSWNGQTGCYDVRLAEDLSQVRSVRREDLRWIPGREFESPAEAASFQAAARQAWDAQFAREELAALRAQGLDAEAYGMAMRPLSLKVQQPVLERFGFRPDFGGQFQLMLAMGPLEAEHPEVKRRNEELEAHLGLSKR